jgi:hypothetical protein
LNSILEFYPSTLIGLAVRQLHWTLTVTPSRRPESAQYAAEKGKKW